MKQYWLRIETRIDAMSLRERAMAFGIAALALITLVDTAMLGPLLKQQRQASQQVTQDQQQIAALQAEIQARVASHETDPDANTRVRLHTLRQQSQELKAQLRGVQNGVVSPDKMAVLLEDILRKHGRLQLLSLKTIPATLLAEPTAAAGQDGKKAASGAPKDKPATLGADAIYKHGVEIVVQGGYVDMVNYLTELEKLPWQVYWSGAKLNADEHAKATLTLNLFTLSLDKQWLHI